MRRRPHCPASLRRRARVEALEGELEVPPFEAPPSPAVQVADESDDVVDVGVLSRLRRARATAVESQNLLRDYVRLGEQCRGLVEWSRPGASLAVFAGLTLFLVVAARMRADYLGVLAVLATMAPGAILSVERRAAQFNASAARVRTDARSASSQPSASRFNEASASLHFFAARRHRALRFARAARRSTLKIAPGAIVASTTHTPR